MLGCAGRRDAGLNFVGSFTFRKTHCSSFIASVLRQSILLHTFYVYTLKRKIGLKIDDEYFLYIKENHIIYKK